MPDDEVKGVERREEAGKMPGLPGPRLPMDGLPMPVLLQAFDPEAEFEVRTRRLPHWRQRGATYFVTFRLGDALPQVVLRALCMERELWVKEHPPPIAPAELRKFQALFSVKVEQYLAAGYGGCWLRRPEVADLVEGTLRHFDRSRYALGRYVVMPNHVHVLVTPLDNHDLSAILHSWKSYTSNGIHGLLGHRGPLWQRESYDHIVRDEDELRHYVRYIEENPTKAGLGKSEFRLG